MGIADSFKRTDTKKTVSTPSTSPPPRDGLELLLKSPMSLKKEIYTNLQTGFEKGSGLFRQFNECRLGLAFKSFDESMKIALYEIIYLLHVNDTFMEEITFRGTKTEKLKTKPVTHKFNLYVKGAPCGVAGIDDLPDLFRNQFKEHVLKTFGQNCIPKTDKPPITGIFSIGSIGTIGHKHLSSDLDLEILYRLDPFLMDTHNWTNKTFLEALMNEVRYGMKVIQKKQGIAANKRINAKLKEKIKKVALADVAKRFPHLSNHLIKKKVDYLKEIGKNPKSPAKGRIIDEIIELMTRNSTFFPEKSKAQEILLKEKIGKIQDYIETRYPEAEVYLFPLSETDMKRGYFGSTIDSKESSGSAYEKIMTYDTLMPGVYYTQTIPAHFLFPKEVNTDKQYKKVLNYIRFNLLDSIYADQKTNLMDQGPTSDLQTEYVARHLGAVYWESFKASFGNLPKALLNLFRFEMFFEKKVARTVIQLIKEPTAINAFAAEKSDENCILPRQKFLPFWALVEIEEKFPLLLFDPWWVRYKALKIGYGEKINVAKISKEEQERISYMLDLAFALHIRLSDVFTKAGSTKKFELYREKVLKEFLELAFPPGTTKRKQVEQIFIGEVSAVNLFENEMRKLFKKSIKRVRKKVTAIGIEDAINQRKEFQIWFHYYETNFETKSYEIHRSILNHLKVPRGRVQIGHIVDEGWFFKSLQMESSLGKRFDMFNIIDQLPPQVDLIKKVPFLYGLAHCIFNGYYGILYKGTLKEKKTSLEFAAKHMNLGNKTDNQLAYIHPGQVEKMMNMIVDFFPYKKVDHRECLKGTKITELLIFFNLIHFGRLSFLYRNNLGSIYCIDKDHPDIYKSSEKMSHNYSATFQAQSLNETLQNFFIDNDIDINDIKLGVWVNTNSFETNHPIRNVALKKKDIEEDFLKQVKRNRLERQGLKNNRLFRKNQIDAAREEAAQITNQLIKMFSSEISNSQKKTLEEIFSRIMEAEGDLSINESVTLKHLISSLKQ